MRFEILIVIIVLMLTWPVESTDDNEEEAKSQEQFVQDCRFNIQECLRIQILSVLFKDQKNLMERRKAHHEVIRRIQELKDAKKEKETVSMLLKKLFEVLVGSLNSLADHVKNTKTNRLEYTPDTMKDISSVIENTAFAADMCLHFPNMFHKLYDTNKEWHPVLESSIGFTIKTGLPDEPTLKAINLVSPLLAHLKQQV